LKRTAAIASPSPRISGVISVRSSSSLAVAHPSGPALPGAGLLLILRSPRSDHLAKPFNRWFVLVRSVGVPWYKRQTKGFPTETQAKLYAKSMLSDRNYVTAGTISPHQPRRRNIDASDIQGWIEEKD